MVEAPAAPPSSSSSSIRFLGPLKQPESDVGIELDESDVVWPSPELPFELDPPTAGDPADLPSSPASSGFRGPSDHRRPFPPEKFGLSAALAEDRSPLVRPRRTAVPVMAARAGTDEGLGRMVGKSAPVNVPVWPRRRGRWAGGLEDGEEGKGEWGEEEEEEGMVPPHVIVANSHVMAFSVFEGVGRTLKGRDLRRVRNAVWRQTGFID